MNLKKHNNPKLRFNTFTCDWNKKRLNEVLKVKGVRNSQQKYSRNDVLSVSGDLGVINQIEHLGRSYAGVSLANYHVVETGDIVYTKSPLKNNPFGIIKANKKKPGIVSTLYAVYEVVKDNDFNFLDRYFELDDRTNRYLRPLVHKGAKNDMKINNDKVLIDPIIIPNYKEQKEIAEFLELVDEWIENLEKQKETLETYKKGLRQKIFSQLIHFKDDNEKSFPEWTERKLSDVLYEHKLKSTGKEEVFSVSVNKGLVNQIKHLGRSYAAKSTDHYNLVKPDDIVYTKSPTGDYPLGIIKQSLLKKSVIVSPLYGVFTPETSALGYLLHSYFESPINTKNYLNPIVFKGAKNTINISNVTFLSSTLNLPKSKKEQILIADLLISFDELIQLKHNQITNAKKWKKGLLQQMFV